MYTYTKHEQPHKPLRQYTPKLIQNRFGGGKSSTMPDDASHFAPPLFHPTAEGRFGSLCVYDVSSYIKYDVVQPSLILLISSLMRLRLTVFEWVYMAHIQIYAHSRSLLLIIFVCKEIERECEQSSLLCVVRFASVYSDTYRTANGLCAEYLNAKWV